jgi:acetyltransferase
MVARPQAEELLAGLGRDPTFGAFVMFGRGGVGVEVAPDRVAGLPPLDRVLARDMIARTAVSARLAGYRDRGPADLDAIADVLARLAQLALAAPEIRELDINPLLADAQGVIALDVRVRLDASDPQARPATAASEAAPA